MSELRIGTGSEVWTDNDCLDELLEQASSGELDEVAEAKLDEATFCFPAVAFACWNRKCSRTVMGQKQYRSSEIVPVDGMAFGTCLLQEERATSKEARA